MGPEQPALPAHGLPAAQVLAEIAGRRERDLPTHGGRLFAYVYDPAVPGLDELAASAHALAAHVNGLDPTAFPSLLAMENALVAAAARRLGGGPDGVPTVVGNVTSGGTESLILAVKAARDARPDVAAPELVVPVSAHAAFAKAAAYLRVRLVPVPVSARTLRPAASDVVAAITPATVLVACSAPAYAHGVIDPVAEIAEGAARLGVRCHVDACFGGWMLPDLRRLGADVPAFDFTLPGVTSISVDLHKYAYCPKGTSIILHRDDALRAPQYFAYADWPGYTMVNATIASTRSGGPIAAAYATLRHLGEDGYLRLAGLTRDAVRGLAAAVSDVDGLRLMAEPESTVVAFTSDDPGLHLFVLADELAARGWHTQPQLRLGDLPASIHLTVTASVAPRVEEFAADLRAAARATRALGPPALPPDLVALAGSLRPDALTPDLVASLAAGLGLPLDGQTPLSGRQAVINALLDAASPPVREGLLAAFLGLLQRPSW
jgi:glutamate/tyrosine decarboxylase-like PLP-dependent enzyme